MYKSGANNVYIGSNDDGEWSPTSSISYDYQTITISGTTNLYYKLEGTKYASTGNSFSLQSKDIDVSSVYNAGKTAGRQEHIDEGYIYTQADVTYARSEGQQEGWDACLSHFHEGTFYYDRFAYVGEGGDYIFDYTDQFNYYYYS